VCEDEAFFEGGIEAEMVGMREKDEVLCAIVRVDAVEVMALIDAAIGVHGSGTMESSTHEDVAQLCSIMSHKFVLRPSAGFTRRGIGSVGGFEFLALFVEESSVGATEKDFASCEFKRALFNNWNHNASHSRVTCRNIAVHGGNAVQKYGK
jgi:hypothetical protein